MSSLDTLSLLTPEIRVPVAPRPQRTRFSSLFVFPAPLIPSSLAPSALLFDQLFPVTLFPALVLGSYILATFFFFFFQTPAPSFSFLSSFEIPLVLSCKPSLVQC